MTRRRRARWSGRRNSIAADEGESAGGSLRIGNINLGVGRDIEPAVFDAAADGDDGEPVFAVTDSFPERALVRPKTLGENFVDDSDSGRGLIIALVEIATLFERNLERGEIAVADGTNLGVVLDAGTGGLAFNFIAVTPTVVADGAMCAAG